MGMYYARDPVDNISKTELIKLLKKFSSTRNGHLWTIFAIELLIELIEDAKQSFHRPYREVPIKRKLEAEEIKKMPELHVIELETS